MKDFLILGLCTKGDIITFENSRADVGMVVKFVPTMQYVYVFKRFAGYAIGYELNWLGKILLI